MNRFARLHLRQLTDGLPDAHMRCSPPVLCRNTVAGTDAQRCQPGLSLESIHACKGAENIDEERVTFAHTDCHPAERTCVPLVRGDRTLSIREKQLHRHVVQTAGVPPGLVLGWSALKSAGMLRARLGEEMALAPAWERKTRDSRREKKPAAPRVCNPNVQAYFSVVLSKCLCPAPYCRQPSAGKSRAAPPYTPSCCALPEGEYNRIVKNRHVQNNERERGNL